MNPKVALVVLLAAVPATASERSAALDGADGAAFAALRGDPQRARAMVATAGLEVTDPAALVVLTSIALDEGRVKDAARLVGRLRSIRPDAAETRLLGALVLERREHPRGDWMTAALAALKSVHPLPLSTPLVDPEERMTQAALSGVDLFPTRQESVRNLRPADAFLARWVWPRSQAATPDVALIDDAIRAARGDERLLVHLAALDVLKNASGPQAEDAAAARRELVDKLQRTRPGSVRLMALAEHSDTDPVTEEDVASLEAAVANDGETSLARHYTDLLRVMEKVDPATASACAVGGIVRLAMSTLYPGTMGSRLVRKPDLSPETLERLARALIRLADLQRREGFLLTDMFSRVSLGMAHSLRDDAALRDRGESVRLDVEHLLDVHRCFAPVRRLPIRSLHREWAEQVPVERAFLEQAARMGLTCPAPPLEPKDTASRDGLR